MFVAESEHTEARSEGLPHPHAHACWASRFEEGRPDGGHGVRGRESERMRKDPSLQTITFGTVRPEADVQLQGAAEAHQAWLTPAESWTSPPRRVGGARARSVTAAPERRSPGRVATGDSCLCLCSAVSRWWRWNHHPCSAPFSPLPN